MPQEQRIRERLTKAQVEEALSLMDKVSILLGQPPFTQQIALLQSMFKDKKADLMKETGMTSEEVDMIADQVPELMGETLSQTFAAMSTSMEQVLNDPEKLKAAARKTS